MGSSSRTIDHLVDSNEPDPTIKNLPQAPAGIETEISESTIDPFEWLKSNGCWRETALLGSNKLNDSSLLHMACEKRAPKQVFQTLFDQLDKDAIHATEKHFGNTVLHTACWEKSPLWLVKMIVENMNKEGIRAANAYGQTALHLACMSGTSPEVLHLLATHKFGSKLCHMQNGSSKCPFDIFPDGAEEREQHIQNISQLHTLLFEDDPTGSYYPRGLRHSIFQWPDKERAECMNESYLRTALNTEILKPFSLFILFMDLAMQVWVVILFSFPAINTENERRFAAWSVLPFYLVFVLIRELVQIQRNSFVRYISIMSNWVDIIQFFLIIAVISTRSGKLLEEQILIPCIAVSWIRLIFATSNLNYSVAVFLDAFIAVTKALAPLVYVVMIICAALAHIYHVSGPPDGVLCEDEEGGGWTCSLLHSYFHVLAMTLGSDYYFLDTFAGPLSRISAVLAFFIGVVLLNMVIALITNKYTQAEERGEIAFWLFRLQYIEELDGMRSCFSWIRRNCFRRDILYNRMEQNNNFDARAISVMSTPIQQLPPRIPMHEYHLKHFAAWSKCHIGECKRATRWYWILENTDRRLSYSGTSPLPNFFTRISAFLKIAQWSDIFFVSHGFRKHFIGIKYGDNKSMSIKLNIMAWFGCSVIVLGVCLRGLVMIPLGFLTGGYFWAREVKEYLFCGLIEGSKKVGSTRAHTRELVAANVGEEMEDKMNKLLDNQASITQENHDLRDMIKLQNVEVKDFVAQKDYDVRLKLDELNKHGIEFKLSMMRQNDELKKHMEEIKQEKDQLRMQMDEIQKANIGVRPKLDEINEHSIEFKLSMMRQNDELKNQLDAIKQEKDEVRMQMDEIQKTNIELKQSLAKMIEMLSSRS